MSAKIIEIPANPKHPTIEDVKRLEHFKHYTDEEAKKLLQTIKILCQVTLSLSIKKHRKQKSKPKTIRIPDKKRNAA